MRAYKPGSIFVLQEVPEMSPSTSYLHVFDFPGDARPDMFYSFGIYPLN
jgi:hypothetical protein